MTQKILEELSKRINQSKITAHISGILCRKIGPRPICSSSMKIASKFIMNELKSFGLTNVHQEQVPLEKWTRGKSKVQLIKSCNSTALAIGHLPFSFLNDTVVQGPLVNAGYGVPENFKKLGKKTFGAVLIMRYDNPKNFSPAWGCFDKAEIAFRHGAKAILFISWGPKGMITPYGGRHCVLPMLAVSSKDRMKLMENSGKSSVKICLRGNRFEKANCFNVLADIGPEDEAEYYLVSAHLDSVYNTPGGFDNVSGICCILEVASLLTSYAHEFKKRIRFAVFTAEEEGMAGAVSYIDAHSDELDKIRLQINADSIYKETAKGFAVHYAPELVRYFQKIFCDAALKVQVKELPSISSDYLPFALLGIPTARPANFHGRFPPWSHTFADTADKIDVPSVKKTALYIAYLLWRLATRPEDYPGRRRTEKEVNREFSRWNLDQLPHLLKLKKELTRIFHKQ